MNIIRIFIPLALVLMAGCRSRKEVSVAEVTAIRDSISVDSSLKREISSDETGIFRFSADSLLFILKADSIRTGDSVIYSPELSCSLFSPESSEQRSSESVISETDVSSVKAGSDSSCRKTKEEVRESKSAHHWCITTAILVISGLLLLFHRFQRGFR